MRASGRALRVVALLVLLGPGLVGCVPQDEDSARAGVSRGDDRAQRSVERRDREPRPGGRERPRRPQRERAERTPGPPPRTVLVTRVVDGDTVELGNGETVRLAGIDTPEVGECGFEAAAAALGRLALGERVRLGRTDEDRDGYGRLLRYVDVVRATGEPVDAGLRLLEQGLAIAAYDSRDGYGAHPRERTYVARDRASRDRCRAMSTGGPDTGQSSRAPRSFVGGGGKKCAAGYRPCLPVRSDLDCADVDGPVRVTGSDPYRLDEDGDGVGCDS